MNVSLSVQLGYVQMLSSLSTNDLYSFVCNVNMFTVLYLVRSVYDWNSQPRMEGGTGLSKFSS